LKLLIYSANYAPEPTGIGKYSGEMAQWLAARGHQVRVVCAPPYYPQWQLAQVYRWPPYRREVLAHVDVWRAPLWVPAKPGGLARIVHLLSFALSSVPVMLWQLWWRPQVVITVAPSFLCAPMGWLTAKLSGAKTWLHIQDFELDVAFQMGLLQGETAQRVAFKLESQVLRGFDRVSSISGRMHARLLSKGVRPQRALHFPNWVDVDAVRPWHGLSAYRAELQLNPGAFVALFSGTWGPKQGLLLIPQAARLLAHRSDIVFVVCGDGVMRPELERACAGLSNVHLLPLQPAERLPELMGLADVHLLTQSPGAEDLVLPSKLSSMLASGRPVVSTCRPNTEIAELLVDSGLVVPPEDAAALAAAIKELANTPALCKQMGASARRVAQERIGTETVLRKLEADLMQLAAL
jgi:colanic acid biosynthesis glycosyl transferase WcaI